jgi:5'-nucleotidase
MNILITNDDGIDSQGIYSLVKKFTNKGNIVICAPDRQRSASSHSLTMHKPISMKKINLFGLECEAYSITGTPVDCVKLAYEKLFNGPIDLLISGINDGANLGTDVLYSGTVSAAIEGAVLGIPSIAVSLITKEGENDYANAANYANIISNKFLQHNFALGTILNINVPSCDGSQINGIMATSLGTIRYANSFEERKDPRGNSYYWLAGSIVTTDNEETTDVFAVSNNYVSVTPMHFELTKFEYLDIIKKWDFI